MLAGFDVVAEMIKSLGSLLECFDGCGFGWSESEECIGDGEPLLCYLCASSPPRLFCKRFQNSVLLVVARSEEHDGAVHLFNGHHEWSLDLEELFSLLD